MMVRAGWRAAVRWFVRLWWGASVWSSSTGIGGRTTCNEQWCERIFCRSGFTGIFLSVKWVPRDSDVALWCNAVQQLSMCLGNVSLPYWLPIKSLHRCAVNWHKYRARGPVVPMCREFFKLI